LALAIRFSDIRRSLLLFFVLSPPTASGGTRLMHALSTTERFD